MTTVFPSRTATPMQEKVHAQEGREYDAGAWIAASSVADTVRYVLGGWASLLVTLAVAGETKTDCSVRVALPTAPDDNPWSRRGDRWIP